MAGIIFAIKLRSFFLLTMHDLDKILNIKRATLKPDQGRVLISNPFLSDYFFRRSVVLLIDHGTDGSFGVIINKPLDIKVSELTTSFPSANLGLYLGGPVKTDGIFFMHTFGNEVPESLMVMDGLYWGGDMQVIDSILKDNPDYSASRIRFFLGYAGWITDQLNNELFNKSWIVANTSTEEIIGSVNPDLWHDKVRELGKSFEPWLNFPPDPSFN